jgi:class III poly(R)-hydroxyalkanoic acid synthase PhaE subunit
MNKTDGSQTADNLLSAWIKSAADFWGSMLQNWPKYGPSGDDSSAAGKSRTQESFESIFNSWQTFSSVAGDPGAMDAFSNLGQTMPDLLSKMVQGSWRSYFFLQQQWLEKIDRIGQSTPAFDFDSLDEEVFKAWTEIYEQEFRQFFYIPQLGLTRFYQEKLNQALDKHNRFQSQYAEFMHLIYLPIEKTFKVLQQQLSDMAQEGKLPENSNDYYKLFIKNLEGHYMSLFKSPDYVTAMSKTLDALEEFVEARNAITQDFLKTMAVPTQDELDELYKELYQLKKRIKILEKEKYASQSNAQKA